MFSTHTFTATIKDFNDHILFYMPVGDLRQFVATWQILISIGAKSDKGMFAKAEIEVQKESSDIYNLKPWDNGKMHSYRELQRQVKEYNATIVPECGEEELKFREWGSFERWSLIIPNKNNLPVYERGETGPKGKPRR